MVHSISILVTMGESKLFSSVKSVDKTLDALFGSSSGPVTRPERTASNSHSKKKEKSEPVEEEKDDDEISEVSDMEDFDGDQNDEEDVDKLLESFDDHKKQSKRRKRGVDADEDTGVEYRYFKKLEDRSKETDDGGKNDDDETPKSKKLKKSTKDNEDEEVSKSSKSSNSSSSILPNEKEVEKSERTIFVGNLSNTTITKKADYKALKRLFSKYGSVESIRFRSISFSEMLPRKAAFVKQQLHSNRDTVNAYIVFGEKKSVSKALDVNGTEFLENHLRVDSVAHPAKHDHKRSIFVGNLDFEAAEEPLWKHFADCGEIEYVRLIRDSKTNVGKGFGYVQFKDSMAIPKALLLDGKQLNGEGRKLRISRAKNISNSKDTFKSKSDSKARLTNSEKSKLGRAKAGLGKAGRAEVNKVIEGTRAKAGDTVPGLKVGGGQGKRKNKPRTRDRTKSFKKSTQKSAK